MTGGGPIEIERKEGEGAVTQVCMTQGCQLSASRLKLSTVFDY